MIKPRIVVRSVTNLLRSADLFPVGENEIPKDHGEKFAVVRYISTVGGPGSLEDEWDEASIQIQVDAFGSDEWEAGWVQDMSRGLIIGRAEGSGFAHELPGVQHGVQSRRQLSEAPGPSESGLPTVLGTYVIGVGEWQSE